jgi:hypothetical protein
VRHIHAAHLRGSVFPDTIADTAIRQAGKLVRAWVASSNVQRQPARIPPQIPTQTPFFRLGRGLVFGLKGSDGAAYGPTWYRLLHFISQ